MEFQKNVPEWKKQGAEPPNSLKESGFQPGYKPPAEYFNWFWNRTSECLAELQAKVSELGGSSKVFQMDIVIPTSGWVDDTDTDGAFQLCLDMTAEGVTESMIPMLTILPQSQKTAKDCKLCPASRTMNGALRIYAQTIPTAEMVGSLALLDSVGGVGSGGLSYILPAATITRLGGVKIGDGVNVEGDGTISVDGAAIVEDVAASEGDVEEMLNTVFGEVKTEEGSN